MKWVKELLPYIIIVLLVVLIRSFIITPVMVEGTSMTNTLHNGDILLLNKLIYKNNLIERFDIVVINYNHKHIVKRIIGLPGENILYENNKLYINDQIVDDPYASNETYDFALEELGYDKIPDNKYLVLGDNRGNSTDSRMIGLIDKKDIVGMTNYRLWPVNKFGNINK